MQFYEDQWDQVNFLHGCSSENMTAGISLLDWHRTNCMFDPKWAYRCNVNRYFGYDDGSPCVLLKLNSVYGWIPPIRKTEVGAEVCCQGATSSDNGFMGTLCFYDAVHHDEDACRRMCGVFPHQFYPYLNQRFYHPPLVFLELRGPKRNVLFRVRCYLNNVNYNFSLEF